MYVARVPNRGSPPAVLLRESYREGGKVKNRTLANLSRWPEERVDALARVLRGLPARVDLAEAFEITRSLPHGHVAAVLGTARRLGIERLLDPVRSRTRDLVTAMLVAQVIAPTSKLACALAGRDGRQLPRAGAGRVRRRRGRPVFRDGLGAGPQGRDRGRAGRPAPVRRHPGALRRVLGRVGGTHLPARCDRPPPRRGEGAAADRLRTALLHRGHPGRGRGLRRQ